MTEICCERMGYDLQHICSDRPDRFDCPDALLTRTRNGFGIIVHDGGTSAIEIAHCPWCGKKLPTAEDRA